MCQCQVRLLCPGIAVNTSPEASAQARWLWLLYFDSDKSPLKPQTLQPQRADRQEAKDSHPSLNPKLPKPQILIFGLKFPGCQAGPGYPSPAGGAQLLEETHPAFFFFGGWVGGGGGCSLQMLGLSLEAFGIPTGMP